MDFFGINGTKPINRPVVENASSPAAHTVYKDVRVGERIKVVRMEGGPFNSYKGYIGEVKDYKRGQDSALVILHAVNCPKLIRMPLEHFVKLPANQ